MLKTIIRTAACLAVSTAAFVAITRMDASAAKPKTAAPEEEASPPNTSRTRSTPAPKPKAPPPKLTLASLQAPAPVAAPAGAAPTRTSPTTGVDSTLAVPDWKGKRLSVAFRDARKLGLHINAVDDEGEAIPADLRASYRVRRMVTRAGTAVAPGADVEVRAREIVETAMGY